MHTWRKHGIMWQQIKCTCGQADTRDLTEGKKKKNTKMTSKLRSEGVTQNDKGIVFQNERLRFYKGLQ